MIKVQNLDFLPKGYFSKFIEKLNEKNSPLLDWYENYGSKVDWKKQIESKESFSLEIRNDLHSAVKNQYQFQPHTATQANIDLLKQSNTYTVTTGQQIHILLGPMYVIYKCISTVLLAKQLAKDFPDKHFVPVFWMATEDHDKEEINYVSIYGRRFNWVTDQDGPVGRFNLDGISALLSELKELLRGDNELLSKFQIFEKAYGEFETLADATRFLINEFFGEYGLIAFDADNAVLKKYFTNIIQKDILHSAFNEAITIRTKAMRDAGFETAINPRKTNFFYFQNGKRIRIDRVGNDFQIGETIIKGEILSQEIKSTPEKFSPNVIMRPLYQETILPNLAYIGGPSEIVYWFQLQPAFGIANIPVPALLPRHHLVLFEQGFQKWLNNSGFSVEQMWHSLTDVQKMALEKIAGENPVDNQLQLFKTNSELLLKVLYDVKSTQLKGIKQLNEQIVKQLKIASTEYSENVFALPKNESLIKKINKKHQLYFNIHEPQERNLFFLEMLLNGFEMQSLISNLNISNSNHIQHVFND